MERLGLTDLDVNGVLSIYAIERRADATAPQTEMLGKDEIFSTAKHWVRSQHSHGCKFRCLVLIFTPNFRNFRN